MIDEIQPDPAAAIEGVAAGRTRARSPSRTPQRTPMREASHMPVRDGLVYGRDGEILSRKRTGESDPFDVPNHMIPDGWSYQWNPVSVYGNADIVLDQGMGFYENGWRPVPADRHPGYFVPRGTTGNIVRGGMRLEERPSILTEQAKAEQERNARRQVSDQTQAAMGKAREAANANGMEMSSRYRGTGGEFKMTIDPALDIPAPQHELAEPGE